MVRSPKLWERSKEERTDDIMKLYDLTTKDLLRRLDKAQGTITQIARMRVSKSLLAPSPENLDRGEKNQVVMFKDIMIALDVKEKTKGLVGQEHVNRKVARREIERAIERAETYEKEQAIGGLTKSPAEGTPLKASGNPGTVAAGSPEEKGLELTDKDQAMIENLKKAAKSDPGAFLQGLGLVDAKGAEKIREAGEDFKGVVPQAIAAAGTGVIMAGGTPEGALLGVPVLTSAFEVYATKVMKIVAAYKIKEADIRDLQDAEMKVTKAIRLMRSPAKKKVKETRK